MTDSTKISIITPSYNQADYIEKSILSVINQPVNFKFEFFIIDGGSTDGTINILKKYQDRLEWISEQDKGQSDALNKGLDRVSGDIIGWLNSDDLYIPGALQKVADYFERHSECKWLYGKCRIINENDQEIRRWITWYKNLLSRKFSYKRLLVENYISQPAVFIKRELFESVGRTNDALHYVMDYDLWLRLGALYSPGYLDEYLACFRVHGQSKSRKDFQKQFREEFQTHKKYHQGRLLLLLHRMNIYKITGIYWMMYKIKTLWQK
jgi:glycosyltransferase involved in cell wall biosynthesis